MRPTVRRHRLTLLAAIALISALCVGRPAAAAGATPGHWSRAFGPTGLCANGKVTSAVVFGDDLVVAGSFATAGRDSVSNIARWDGQRWWGFGKGLSGIECLAMWNGQLFAGGNFKIQPGRRTDALARWDGQAWQPAEPALQGQVNTLTVYRGALVVGGRFTFTGDESIRNLARWDGKAWLPLGEGVTGVGKTRVLALTVHGDELAVGGMFLRAGGKDARNLACWDGHGWSAVGTGTDDVVQALCSTRGVLYAGGCFRIAGGDSVFGIAAWDGRRWSTLGTGMRSESWSVPIITALVPWRGTLVAAGSFVRAGGVDARGIASWDGSSWSATPPGCAAMDRTGGAWNVRSLLNWDDRLVVGGNMGASESATINGLALWDGTRWDPLVAGQGIGGYPDLRAVSGSMFMECGGGIAGSENVRGTAVWANDRWQSLAIPTDSGQSFDVKPQTMTARDGRTVAIGRFRAGAPASACEANPYPWHLAELGDRWHVISTALPCEKAKCNELLAVGKELFVIGEFGAEPKPTEGAMIWDGQRWRLGCLNLDGGSVGDAIVVGDRILVVVRHDSNDPSKASTYSIMEGDGHSWRSIRDTTGSDIRALVNWDGRVVAFFERPNAAGAESHSLQVWDGRSWAPLPGEFSSYLAGDGRINALAIHQGYLVAAGTFKGVDGHAAANVAFLADGIWRPLGSGLDSWASDLASSADGLWLSGQFKHAGGELSLGVARWDGPLPADLPLEAIPAFVPNPPPRPVPFDAGAGDRPVVSATASPVINGDFLAWVDDGVPEGWKWRSQCPKSAAADSARAPDLAANGGVKLHAGAANWCSASLSQTFPITAGRCYRLRARFDAMAAPAAGEPTNWKFAFADYARSASGYSYGPLHTGMEVALSAEGGWAEVTLRADRTATEGVVSISSRGPAPDLVLREVLCDTVAVTDAEAIQLVCAGLRRRLVIQADRAVDWDSLKTCAIAELTGSGQKMGLALNNMLRSLDEQRITTQSGHSDVQMIGLLSEGKPLPESDALSRARITEIRAHLSDWQQSGAGAANGWTGDAIAYVQAVSSMSSQNWQTDLTGAAGILLDLRGYDGSSRLNEWRADNLRAMASSCADLPRTWAFARSAAATGSAEDTLRVTPATGPRVSLPTVCLIDASTSGALTECALTMKALPGVTLVGRPTRGGSGGMEKLLVPSGEQINFPARSLWDPQGRLINDDHGVEPDILVAPGDSTDPVFVEGLRVLRQKIAASRR